MAKKDEIAYLDRIGEQGRQHAAGKPFTDPQPWMMLEGFSGILRLLPLPPARIVDFGCGTGWTSVFLARSGYEVVGVDIAADMIELARSNARDARVEHNTNWEIKDYEHFAYGAIFDAAVFFDSLHHAEDERQALQCAFESLKPGGLLITHEPGRGHAAAEGSRQAMEKYGVTEKDMPPRKILRLGKEIGFEPGRIVPMPEVVMSCVFGQTGNTVMDGLLRSPLVQAAAHLLLWLRRRGSGSIVTMQKPLQPHQ